MPVRSIILTLVVIMTATSANAQVEQPWSQLSLSTCRVDEFLADHPLSDGRGVVIAVLDTGVDPSIPGLRHLPDGSTKVIDVQDFTGQGDIELKRVRLDESTGRLIHHEDDGAPIYYDMPSSLPATAGETRRFYFGFIEEHKFVNSDVGDLNDNGTSDDKFPICVTALTGDGDDQAICYVDTNIDRSFADEKPLRNYKLGYDTFTLFREKPEAQIEPVAFAVNISLRQSKVVLYYDDGAHGTHVAGLAAGYNINDQPGFNGVAPGAKVMGLKIGQCAVGGISTTAAIKKALEHAANYAQTHGVPVVCNLSYGVESVIEGSSDIDKYLDKFLRQHPYVIFCSSAGNEGPGLSTVGTPAAAAEVLSIGALLAVDSARDVMGMTFDEPVVTVFSSCGGEADKPDFAVPGWSTSTVPRWVKRGDYWAGTSMASPYAAGLCAALISDAMQRHPGVQVRACDVRRALALSCTPGPDANPLMEGYGVPDLPKAAAWLDRLIEAAKDDPIVAYDISTPCPHGYKGKARAAYWRSLYHPTDERQTFTVSPVFMPGIDGTQQTSFVRKFQLRSTAPWCRIPQKEVYLRSAQAARVYVEYDGDKLTEPGLYTGTVVATHEGVEAFRLRNTVIVPYRVTAETDFTLDFKNQTVSGWSAKRYFVSIPAGATSMVLTLTAPEGKDSKASFERIYDPNGKRLRVRSNKLDTNSGKREVVWTVTDELIPGVWEIPVVSNRPDKSWPFDLEVRFLGLHAEPTRITSWSGSKPSGDMVITNVFDKPVPTSADGMFEGFRLHKEDTFEGLEDELSYTLTLNEAFDRVRVDLELTPEAFATTTDVGVRMEVGGKEIYSSALSNRTHSATVRVPGVGEATKVKLIVQGGFALADEERETPITVRFDQLLAEPIAIDVTRGGSSSINFVPGVPIPVAFAVEHVPPATPDGTHAVGYLRFRDKETGKTALRVPVEIDD